MKRILSLLPLFLAGCAGSVRARPGVGMGFQHNAEGARMGIDLGTYDIAGAAAHPVSGECPGGVCSLTPASVSFPWLWLLGAALALTGGLLAWRYLKPQVKALEGPQMKAVVGPKV